MEPCKRLEEEEVIENWVVDMFLVQLTLMKKLKMQPSAQQADDGWIENHT